MVHGGMWMRGDKQDDGSFMSSLYNVLMQATGLQQGVMMIMMMMMVKKSYLYPQIIMLERLWQSLELLPIA